ncbi:MAG TPA: protoporphyrinogen oxidase [Terriglobales bacterium]|jgi:oxygen-dependent protoporphyrinogen oxidase|nr:protoporphyrinogen oxidase [Terriglobales bacterium]
MTKRIAVIGGGTSGLSAAYSLEKRKSAGTPLEFVLYEAGRHFGGVIRTEQIEDCVVEAGPDSFLTEKPWAADLCRELGLGDQLIPSNDAERRTYMLIEGRLVPIPDGLMFMVPTKLVPAFLSPLFSAATKARMVREWLAPPQPKTKELTVAEFIARHYGREMVDRVADPLLAGVYGGGADQLSVDAVLPRFVQMETKYRSLGRAMAAAAKNVPPSGRGALFTSLKRGMQQLTNALVSRLPADALRAGVKVERIQPESGKWLVVSNGRTEEYDAVLLATPAHVAGALLTSQLELAKELNEIPYTSSMTIVLGYGQKVRSTLPPGFGLLVPRTEGRKILATTFVHNKFPFRVPEDRALLRCFLGGSVAEEMFDQAEVDLIGIVEKELKSIFAIEERPVFTRVYKWRKAMAQYTVGHLARVARIKSLVTGMPGFALAGNAYAGIGVPDCVRTGEEAANKVFTDVVPR